jgi:hypothetical protein
MTEDIFDEVELKSPVMRMVIMFSVGCWARCDIVEVSKDGSSSEEYRLRRIRLYEEGRRMVWRNRYRDF